MKHSPDCHIEDHGLNPDNCDCAVGRAMGWRTPQPIVLAPVRAARRIEIGPAFTGTVVIGASRHRITAGTFSLTF